MTNSLTVFCEECGKQWKVCDFPIDIDEMVSLINKTSCTCGAEQRSLYIGSAMKEEKHASISEDQPR